MRSTTKAFSPRTATIIEATATPRTAPARLPRPMYRLNHFDSVPRSAMLIMATAKRMRTTPGTKWSGHSLNI